MTSALYGNGQRVNYKYDSLDRPVIKYYNNDNPNNAGYHTCLLYTSGIPFQNVSSNTIIPVDGKTGDVYTFGGWSKAASIATDGNGKSSGSATRNPVYQFYLFFLDSNNNRLNHATAKFNPAINDWQFVSGTAKASKPYSYIQFFISYDNNAGDVYMLSLIHI